MSIQELMGANDRAVLLFSDGSYYEGVSFGSRGIAFGELVFNTAMTGYQEIMTDPSYAGQIVTFTYPHIGNVGINADDEESAGIVAKGAVIRALSPVMSNWRSEQDFSSYLKAKHVVGIAEVDTRAVTRRLREQGAQMAAIIATDTMDIEATLSKLNALPAMSGLNLASAVSRSEPEAWDAPSWQSIQQAGAAVAESYHVVAYDFGVKHQILRLLVDRGCRLTVVPADTSAEAVLAMNPDGVFLSNGPGDPAACRDIITTIQSLLAVRMPLFGICLGCQLLALAEGGQTTKMKFGHHGANHPVLDVRTGRVAITSQNHGFCIDESSLPSAWSVTHRSLFDHTLQGIRHSTLPAFGFQGHPEASPGPDDIHTLFDEFIQLLEEVSYAKTK
jgi:carbamoyl-phosphate synthase small subunit